MHKPEANLQNVIDKIICNLENSNESPNIGQKIRTHYCEQREKCVSEFSLSQSGYRIKIESK